MRILKEVDMAYNNASVYRVMRILKERLLTLVELLKELIQRENFRSSGSR